MRRTPATLASLLIATLALAGCTGQDAGPTRTDLVSPPTLEGVEYVDVPESAPTAPDGRLSLPTGETFDLSEVSDDRPVVLLFFEPWCTSCAAAQDDLDSAASEYGDAVSFIGVSSAADEEEILSYAREHDVAYPLVKDEGGNLAASFAVDEAPFTVVLGEGNRLLRGRRSYPDDLGAAVAALLVRSMPVTD